MCAVCRLAKRWGLLAGVKQEAGCCVDQGWICCCWGMQDVSCKAGAVRAGHKISHSQDEAEQGFTWCRVDVLAEGDRAQLAEPADVSCGCPSASDMS